MKFRSKLLHEAIVADEWNLLEFLVRDENIKRLSVISIC